MKIRYYGAIAPTGFGRATIEMCMALHRQPGVELEIAPMVQAGATSVRLPKTHLPLARLCKSSDDLDPNPDVVIVHTLPWDCVRALSKLGAAGVAPGAKRIAYTTWEALYAPERLAIELAQYDRVWLPSAPAARAFAGTMSYGDHVFDVMPHCFDEATFEERSRRVQSEGAFRFYYLGAWNVRKNPAAVLRAYAHAFTKDDPVELIIQSSGANPTSIRLAGASTGLSAADFPDLRVRTEMISDADVLELHRGADCFVTASHGEAWNLPAFDAMLAGRHVIAPHGLGSDEFLAETSAALYGGAAAPAQHDVRMIPGSSDLEIAGVQGMSARCLWVEPSMEALIACMRDAVKHRRRDLTANYDPRERFGYEAVGKRAVQLLQE